MIRLIAYAIKIAILVAIGYWLVEHPGHISLEWQGYIIETSTSMMVVVLVVALAIAAMLYRGWYWLVSAPAFWGHKRDLKRRDQGYEALTRGLIAIAAGDATLAGKQTKKARKLLDDMPLTLLLAAQSAQLNGQQDQARDTFRAMLEQPALAFFGIRGLLSQELRDHGRRDHSGAVNTEALKLAREAFRHEPTSPWVVETLLDLEVLAEEYDRALGLIDQQQRLDLLDRHETRRRKAALYVARSLAAEAHERTRDARSHAARAVRLSPDFIPAVLRWARYEAADNRLRHARSALERAWQTNPHPALAALWLDLSPYKDAEGRLGWLQRLCTGSGLEATLAVAPLLLENGRWDEARRRLTAVLDQQSPDVRVLRLLADLELKESSDTVAAADWLNRIDHALPAPTWIALDTGHAQSAWTPISAETGRFDMLAWLRPAPAGTGTALPALTPSATVSLTPLPVRQTGDKPAPIDASFQELDGTARAS